MKYKRRKARADLKDLGNNPIDTLIPILILLAFIVLIGIGIINVVFGSLDNAKTAVEDIWLQTFTNLEQKKVGVNFNQITTTEDEYTILRMESNKFIEESNIDKKDDTDTQLVIDATINEEVYVDNVKDTSSATDIIKEKEFTVMNESGPLYFEDMILLRYITGSGKMRVVGAYFENKDKSKVKMMNQSEFNIYTDTKEINKENKKTEDDITEESINENNINGLMDEEQYLTEIGDLLIQIFKAATPDEFKEAKRLANQYFSVDGRKTVFEGKEQVKLKTPLNINIKFMEAGKSDTSLITKNRVYIQMGISSSTAEEETVLDIVLKMNEYGRIFDVDIL